MTCRTPSPACSSEAKCSTFVGRSAFWLLKSWTEKNPLLTTSVSAPFGTAAGGEPQSVLFMPEKRATPPLRIHFFAGKALSVLPHEP